MNKKRLIVFIIIVIIFSYFSYAFTTVSLNNPSDDALIRTTRNVSFDCSLDDYSGVVSVSFYHNISGSFILNQSISNPTSSVNFKINNTIDGTYKWNCLVNDGTTTKTTYFASSNYTFKIKYNKFVPQFLGYIGNLTFKEDSYNDSVNLSNYFSDSDGDNLTYYVLGGSNLVTSIDGTFLNITPNANWTGYSSITINASDGRYSNVSNLFYADVTPVNDPPHLKEDISDKNWSMGQNKTIDLTDYFDDIDGDPLNYTFSNVSNIGITISSGGTANLVPSIGFNGTRTINFTATDGIYNTTSNNLNLNVVATLVNVTVTNTGPVITDYSPRTNVTINEGESVQFVIGKYDADNDSLTVSWYLDSRLLQNEIGNSYTFSNDRAGLYTVEVIVSDGMLINSNVWNIEVVEEEESEPFCGDKNVDAGENCFTCPADVRCGDDQVCKNNICQKKSNNLIWILVILVILLVAGGVGFYFLKDKFGKKVNPDEEIVVGEAEPSEDINVDITNKSEDTTVNITSKPQSTADVLDNIDIKTTIDLSGAENFIKGAFIRGWTEDRIKRDLIKKGWRLEHIEQAFRNVGR